MDLYHRDTNAFERGGYPTFNLRHSRVLYFNIRLLYGSHDAYEKYTTGDTGANYPAFSKTVTPDTFTSGGKEYSC
jgi:hypothetical protein